MSQGNNGRLNVLSPIERQDGKTFWLRVGTAFYNKDGSINIYLDALPVNGRLQLRQGDRREPQERPGQQGSRA